MAQMLFVLAFVVPPAVIALGAVALAIGSLARHGESPAALRQHHA